MKVAQSRILLTGAAGGIGAASASRLARAGAALMLTGRSPARLAEQARMLTREHGVDARQVEWFAADLARESELQALAQAAIGWNCNLLVHAAGVPAFGRFEDLDARALGQVLHLNLQVPMLLTHALVPHLRAQSHAGLVYVGSVLGRLALPGFSVYSASKFGLRGFAEALRRELADTRVRVQYLGPRSTRTAFNAGAVERYNEATKTAMDAPEAVAQALLQLIDGGAPEQFLGFPEKWAVRLNGLAPGLLDGAFTGHRRSLAAASGAAGRPASRGAGAGLSSEPPSLADRGP